MTTAPADPELHGWRWLVGPSFIYGTIFVTAVMVVAEDTQSNLDVFLITFGTIVAVWVAHTFSEVVAGGPSGSVAPTPPREILRHALEHSEGLLAAGVLPLLMLLLGSFLGTEHWTYYAAVGIAVVSLAVVGWFAVRRRGYGWPYRLVGSVATAVVGALVVFLKSLLT